MTDVVAVVSSAGDDGAVDNLGARLRSVRMESGLSLRELARRLGVSPSFVSQMENGKSQPSVATLYAMAQLLNVSIDELFMRSQPPREPSNAGVVDPIHGRQEGLAFLGGGPVNRADIENPSDVWMGSGGVGRLQILMPGDRPQLEMDSGVVWEQLAVNRDRSIDFLEIVYPAGASSTNDGRMLRHPGVEYGYILEGTVQITYGFETHILQAGMSMCLDPSVPHLLTNPGKTDARGVWVLHHGANAGDTLGLSGEG